MGTLTYRGKFTHHWLTGARKFALELLYFGIKSVGYS